MTDLVADAQSLFHAAVRHVQADRLLDAASPDAWGPEPLDAYDRLVVVGMGKAAMAMAGAVEARLGERVEGGCVVVPDGYPQTLPNDLPAPKRVDVREGGHPEPSHGSVRAGRELLRCADAADSDTLVVVLVSGGGTALATVPAHDLMLEDVADASRRLLRAGVPIREVNVVRKHLTQVGGGQLAAAARPADVAGLVVSDVVGDDLSSIASGPTVPDPSTYTDAVRVLYRRGLWSEVAPPIREHLSAGANRRRPDTPGEAAGFEHVRTQLLGTNRMALTAAREVAEERGYTVRLVDAPVEGEAREVGRDHAASLLDAEVDAPTVWLWGGETTVTVRGSGTGGRNQELALAAAQTLDGSDRAAVLLSGGTDGIDGPTDAAGAWATPATLPRARDAGLDAADHLARNDSYSFFEALDQLLTPGPTHTNVMDVQVGILDPTQ